MSGVTNSSNRVAFVSDVAPQHMGHGGAVYPCFLGKALARHGIVFEWILPDGLRNGGIPIRRHARGTVAGWWRIGSLSVSPLPYDWIRFLYRLIRKPFRVARPAQAVSKIDNGKQSVSASNRFARSLRQRLRRTLMRFPSDVIVFDQPTLLRQFCKSDIPDKHIFVLTHDVLHERVAVYERHGWSFDFVPLSRDEETRLLARADVIVAISGTDAETFRAMLPGARIVVAFPPIVGTLAPKPQPRLRNGKFNCLFVGGGARHNRETLAAILKVWPAVLAAVPSASLEVVGGAGASRGLGQVPERVTIHGRLNDVGEAYAKADLVLAFVTDGSGVKIKLLEAVAYRVPTIASIEALRGLPGPASEVFPVIEPLSILPAFLLDCATSPNRLDQLALKQAAWAREHLDPDQLIRELREALCYA
jgi:succinoglycan biosynthesis protein ExoO